MTEKFKPCPFCGGTDIRSDRHQGVGTGLHRGEDVYSMCCYNCGATFPNRYKPELLVEAWNKRVPDIDWQPISTAPRDGKPFLAWCSETGDQGIDTARWSRPDDPKVGYFRTRYGWAPTHWSPMPKPPERITPALSMGKENGG